MNENCEVFKPSHDNSGEKTAIFCARCRLIFPYENETALMACPKCGDPCERVHQISLGELSSQLLNRLVLIDFIVVAESLTKATPVAWRCRCEKCGAEIIIDLRTKELRRFLAEGLASSSLGPAPKKILRAMIEWAAISENTPEAINCLTTLCKGGKPHTWTTEPLAWLDFKLAKIRPDMSFYDLSPSGAHARDYNAIILGNELDHQTYWGIGRIAVHREKKDIIPVVEFLIPKEKLFQRPSASELNRARNLLKGLDGVNGWFSFLEPRFCPQIVGREDAKLSAYLTIASPLFVELGPRKMLSTLRTMFIGDPRTGKGTLIRWVRDILKVDTYAIGEQSRRTGLGYAVDAEANLIIWGVLPQADARIALIEALHGFPGDQLLQLREALYQGCLIVRQKVSGARFCRTRILADANPSNPLSSEVFPILAIPKVRCFRDVVDVTRWDIFIPFGADDVPKEKIMTLQDRPDDFEFLQTLRVIAALAWSLSPSEIAITGDAYRELNERAAQMVDNFSFQLCPWVHGGFRESLLKVAAAFAIGSLNLTNGVVLVEDIHISWATEFFNHLFDRWQLPEAKIRFSEERLTDTDYTSLKLAIEEEDALLKVLETLALQELDGFSLASQTGYQYSYVRKLTARLKELGLINRRHSAYCLTQRGAEFLRRFLAERGKQDQENQGEGGA